MYVFPTALELEPGVQYFVYENGALSSSGGNIISGGQAYTADAAGNNFSPVLSGASANFTVSGAVVSGVPEPSALMVFITALLGFGLLRRYRANG
jgi:hypothetical protein